MKTKIKILILAGVLLVMSGSCKSSVQGVYITRHGSRYHTRECSYLGKSKIFMELNEAVGRGYAPCKRCNPPVLSNENE